MTKIDLRRGDFEGMHPKAKLFGFDEDKKLYTGDGVESINHQWTTWCACIGMLHLGGKEAQAVPEVITIGNELQSWVAVNYSLLMMVRVSYLLSMQTPLLQKLKN